MSWLFSEPISLLDVKRMNTMRLCWLSFKPAWPTALEEEAFKPGIWLQ
jgi:hypothetical protein